MRGPSTKLWRTPKGRITASEKLSPILIFCLRFERYDLIHDKTVLSRPNQLCKQSYKRELEDRSQKKKIMFLHSKNKASRKGYKGEC